jgi:hypothetical protein
MNAVEAAGMSPEEVDAYYDAFSSKKNFNERMGFTTRDERFISRTEASRRTREKFSELPENFEEHSGGMQAERQARKAVIGEEKLLGEERRGQGKVGEVELTRRKNANKFAKQLNKEIADLTTKSEYTREGNLKTLVKPKRPTGKFSPPEVQAYLGPGSGGPESKEKIIQRIRDIRKRHSILTRQGATRLSEKAKSLRGLRAVGPVLGVLTSPFETAKRARDLFTGGENERLAAVEHFQGLPSMSTGRGLTEEEKKQMANEGRPWYDPRRRQGGI